MVMWKQSIHAVLLVMILALVLGGSAYGKFDPLKDPAIVGWWAFDEPADCPVAIDH